MPPRFCQQSDVERAVGGAAQLVQLLDKDADNVADLDLVNQAIDAACNELASYIEPTVAAASLSAPFPLILVLKSADAAAFYAWRFGAYGQAIPDNVLQAHEKAISWAKDVGAKTATLVVSPKATLNQPVGVVDHDSDGTKLSVAGLKRGFR